MRSLRRKNEEFKENPSRCGYCKVSQNGDGHDTCRDEGKLKHITLMRAQEWLNNQPVNSNRTNTMNKPTLSTIFESYWGSNTHQGYAEIFELATMMSGKSFIHRNYVSVRGTSQGLHIKDLSFPDHYRVVKNVSIQDELDVLQVYFFKDSECLAMMDIRGRHTKRSVDLYCLTDVFDEFDKCLQDQLLKDEKRVHVASLNEKGEMSVAAEPYFMTPDLMPHDAFYPQLSKPVKQYYDSMLASRNPLTVLVGPPGGGKTTFLRGLVNHADMKALMAFDARLYQNTELIKYFYASSYDLLVLEDAELILEPREKGNGNAASLLNYLDGVVRYPNKRVVISCNLTNTSKFEEATLRVGRCHDVRMFPHLTLQEALLAREAIGRSNDLDLESLGDKIALTDALNYGEDGNFKRHTRVQGIGFGN